MDRLGFVDPNALSREQQEFYNAMIEHSGKKFGDAFQWKYPDGRMLGPFGIELNTPSVGWHWLGMTQALAKLPGLPAQAREVAIVTTGALTGAAYEVYAHTPGSGLSEGQIQTIKSGACPEGLDKECQTAFNVAKELSKSGPLELSAWEEAVSVFGRDGAIALVQYVAFYKYVSCILNGFDARVP